MKGSDSSRGREIPAPVDPKGRRVFKIDRLDHLVLTVRDVEATCGFYTTVLGMEVVTFGEGRKALAFGSQRINLHRQGKEVVPHAHRPTPGSADLCFVTTTPLKEVLVHLRHNRVESLEGPVRRTGAAGDLLSLYFRDPDGNLIELSNARELDEAALGQVVELVVSHCDPTVNLLDALHVTSKGVAVDVWPIDMRGRCQ